MCKGILSFVGSGKKGTEVRKQLGGPPYGWPQDAIDAALIVLFGGGLLQARSGTEPVAKGRLDQKTIAAVEFRVETITLSTVELIAVRSLFKRTGLNTNPGQETTLAPVLLAQLDKLAQTAGGDPPLPERPDTTHLGDLANRAGNDQLKAIHACKTRLDLEIVEWRKRKELIEQRQEKWQHLKSLLAHATDLPVARTIQAEVDAIERDRRLLDEHRTRSPIWPSATDGSPCAWP